MAAIVDIGLFERIRRLDEELANLTREIADAFANVEPGNGRQPSLVSLRARSSSAVRSMRSAISRR